MDLLFLQRPFSWLDCLISGRKANQCCDQTGKDGTKGVQQTGEGKSQHRALRREVPRGTFAQRYHFYCASYEMVFIFKGFVLLWNSHT